MDLGVNDEFYNIYKGDLRSITTHENNFIDISLDARILDRKGEIVLVTQLTSNDKSIHWAGKKFYSTKKSENANWNKIFQSIKLSDVYQNYNEIEINISIWNKDKSSLLIDNLSIDRRDGNPWLYGLYEPLYESRQLK